MNSGTNEQIRPSEYDIFVGIDVDKRNMAMTIVDHDQRITSKTMPNNPEILLSYMRRHFQGRKAVFAYEAGPTGYGLYDALRACDSTCLVLSPSLIPKKAGKLVKTNRLDSLQIAEQVRGAGVNSIRVPDEIIRHLRHLTQLRGYHADQVKASKIRLRALTLFESLQFPEEGSPWSNKIIQALRDMPCAPAVKFKIESLLDTLSFHRAQTAKIIKELRRLCKNDPDLNDSIRFLTSIPGIGFVVAAHVLARIGDWRLMRSPQELGSYFGLTPREYSTGDHDGKSRITTAGDARVRSLLIEASWVAIRRDQELLDFYQRIYKRHDRRLAAKKAIVAVARKLTTRIFSVLKERREYIIH